MEQLSTECYEVFDATEELLNKDSKDKKKKDKK